MNENGLRLSAFCKTFSAVLFFTLSHFVINQAKAAVVFGKISTGAGQSLETTSISYSEGKFDARSKQVIQVSY